MKQQVSKKGKCWDYSPIVQRRYGLDVAEQFATRLATQTGLCLGPRFIVPFEGLVMGGWCLYTY